MGGAYPSGARSWNFWGSGHAGRAAHVVNTWEGRVVYVGNDVGKHVLTGGPLMQAGGPAAVAAAATDPVRMAYIYYGYYRPRPSWDPLAMLYAIYGLGNLFRFGNEYGRNHAEPDGSNRWVWDEGVRNQFFFAAEGG